MPKQLEESSKKRRRRRKSNKGALVKGVSNKLPADILWEPSFKKGLKEISRGYSGIYVLYKRKKLYYVGLAKDLYWRLVSHTRDRHKGKWDRFAIFRVGRVRYLKDIESLLLRVASPPGNSVKGHFHRLADLTKVLKKIQTEQVRRLNRIRKVLNPIKDNA